MKTLTKPAKKKPRAARGKALQSIFTARDLNRQPAAILKACDKFGSVRIQTRDGRAYSLRAEPAAASDPGLSFLERMKRHHARMKAAGWVQPTPAQMELIDRIIAGEE